MGSLDLPFFPQQSWAGNADGRSPAFEIASFKKVQAVLDVQFLGGGTPTLNCRIDTSMNMADWVVAGYFTTVAQVDIPSTEVLTFTPMLQYVRALAVLATTPESQDNPGKLFFSLKGIATD